jgi:hypothetical protein
MDLKRILMELGNKLVMEHHYEPAVGWCDDCVNNTHPIKKFTEWVNEHPKVQEVLRELGLEWSLRPLARVRESI